MLRYQDNQRQVKALAWKTWRRLCAAGASGVLVEDIESELAVAWCAARDGYDPNLGKAGFPTYLQVCMERHINRWAKRAVREASLAISIDTFDCGEDVDGLHEVVADDAPSPEDVVIAFNRRVHMQARMRAKLSERALLFVQLLDEVPPELDEALSSARFRSAYARERGIPSYAQTEITASLVYDVMGATRYERREINAELNRFAAKVNQK